MNFLERKEHYIHLDLDIIKELLIWRDCSLLWTT
nr:MAG TPA: hypothetical protein [Bacteriophage sp.]